MCKKILLLGLFCLVVSSQSTAQVKNGFRKTPWLAAKNEVKKIELGEGQEIKEFLVYDGYLGSFPVDIIYVFNKQNQLTKGRYRFKQSHSNKNEFISDFNEIKAELEKLYGPPDTSGPKWKGELFRDSPAMYGMAIATGQLQYSAIWNKGVTDIFLSLTGDNYEIRFSLGYFCTSAPKEEKSIEGL